MGTDPAIDFFREDAKRLGITVREYERRFGILTMSAEHRIAAHETPTSALAEGWERHVIGAVGGDSEAPDQAA